VAQSQYWNPKTETLPKDELRALQFAKLQRLVAWAEARSPFYRRSFRAAGFESAQLRSWDDWARIPFLTRDEWMRSQLEHPPYGELHVAGPEAAITLHTTSGTSGKTPLRALDTRKDWAWSAEMWCYALWAAGARPSDVGYLAFGYGSFIGFWGLHNGMEKLGMVTIPGGAQTTAARVRQIVDFDVTVVGTTPTYAFRLAQEARELGIDLRASKVRTLILSGESAGSISETRRLIEEEWGAEAVDTAGMTEIGTIFMFEAAGHPGGAHIIEDHFIETVVGPDLEELPYGERGERVTTSFGRGMIPLIKYRTGDAVIKVPHTVAGSGRTFDLYQGGIIGRVDDMKLVRGTNVYPGAVEAVVRGFPIEEFQIRIERVGIRDEIFLAVEPASHIGDAEWSELEAALRTELADAHEGLRFIVERAGSGELPRFELKAKRLQDLR